MIEICCNMFHQMMSNLLYEAVHVVISLNVCYISTKGPNYWETCFLEVSTFRREKAHENFGSKFLKHFWNYFHVFPKPFPRLAVVMVSSNFNYYFLWEKGVGGSFWLLNNFFWLCPINFQIFFLFPFSHLFFSSFLFCNLFPCLLFGLSITSTITSTSWKKKKKLIWYTH